MHGAGGADRHGGGGGAAIAPPPSPTGRRHVAADSAAAQGRGRHRADRGVRRGVQLPRGGAVALAPHSVALARLAARPCGGSAHSPAAADPVAGGAVLTLVIRTRDCRPTQLCIYTTVSKQRHIKYSRRCGRGRSSVGVAASEQVAVHVDRMRCNSRPGSPVRQRSIFAADNVLSAAVLCTCGVVLRPTVDPPNRHTPRLNCNHVPLSCDHVPVRSLLGGSDDTRRVPAPRNI